MTSQTGVIIPVSDVKLPTPETVRAVDKALEALVSPQSKYPKPLADYIEAKRRAILAGTTVTIDDPTRYLYELSVPTGYAAVFLPLNKERSRELSVGLPEDAVELKGMWILPAGTYTLDRRAHKPNNHPMLCESGTITVWEWQAVENVIGKQLINKATEQCFLKLLDGPLAAQILTPELDVAARVQTAAQAASTTLAGKDQKDAAKPDKLVKKIEQIAGLQQVQIKQAKGNVYELPTITVPKDMEPVRVEKVAPEMKNLINLLDQMVTEKESSLAMCDRTMFKISWRPGARIVNIATAMSMVPKSHSAIALCEERVTTLFAEGVLKTRYPDRLKSLETFSRLDHAVIGQMINDVLKENEERYGIRLSVLVRGSLLKTDPVSDPGANGDLLARITNITLESRADGVKAPKPLPTSEGKGKSSLVHQAGETDPMESSIPIDVYLTLSKRQELVTAMQTFAGEMEQKRQNAMKEEQKLQVELEIKMEQARAKAAREKKEFEEKERAAAEAAIEAEKKAERDATIAAAKAEKEKKAAQERLAKEKQLAREREEAKEQEEKDQAEEKERLAAKAKERAKREREAKEAREKKEREEKEREFREQKEREIAKAQEEVKAKQLAVELAEKVAAAERARKLEQAKCEERERQLQREKREAEEKETERKAAIEAEEAKRKKDKEREAARIKAEREAEEQKERDAVASKAFEKKQLEEKAKFEADKETKMQAMLRTAAEKAAEAEREEKRLEAERKLQAEQRAKAIERHKQDMEIAKQQAERDNERRAREAAEKAAETAHRLKLMDEEAKLATQAIKAEADRAEAKLNYANKMLSQVNDPDLRRMFFMNFVLGVGKDELYRLEVEKIKATAKAEEAQTEKTKAAQLPLLRAM